VRINDYKQCGSERREEIEEFSASDDEAAKTKAKEIFNSWPIPVTYAPNHQRFEGSKERKSFVRIKTREEITEVV